MAFQEVAMSLRLTAQSVVNDVVIVGNSAQQGYNHRGWKTSLVSILAYDAKTARLVESSTVNTNVRVKFVMTRGKTMLGSIPGECSPGRHCRLILIGPCVYS